jgi:hypothetical protein
MTEFHRLLDDDATDFERALLRSAAADQGSLVARERSVRAAAVAAALITAQSVGVAAAPSALAVTGLVKWGVTGILLGTVFATTTRLLHPMPELPRNVQATPPASAVLEIKPAHRSPTPEPPRRSEPAPAASASFADAAEPAVRPAARPERIAGAERIERMAGAERTVAPSTSESALAAELAILRETRSLLGAGDGSSALRALDRYAASFPEPKLQPEATLLRIEALLATGARGPAQVLADRFLAGKPSGAHADRARTLRERAARSE